MCVNVCVVCATVLRPRPGWAYVISHISMEKMPLFFHLPIVMGCWGEENVCVQSITSVCGILWNLLY